MTKCKDCKKGLFFLNLMNQLDKLLDTIEEQVGRIENEENENLLEIIKLY